MCEARALGSVGTAVRPLGQLREQCAPLRALTDLPFAINHTARPLDEEAFAATLAFAPAVVSFHLAVPADLIARAHDAGIVWLQQVVDVHQAEEAAAAGADVIIAQGGEGGGNGGFVSTIVLVPQVVDIAGEIPVVAAGGIADGRGLPPRWRSVPRVRAWAPAFSPRPRWLSPANGSSASSTPTRSMPSR